MNEADKREIQSALASAATLAEVDPQARDRLRSFLRSPERWRELEEAFGDDPELLERMRRLAREEGSRAEAD